MQRCFTKGVSSVFVFMTNVGSKWCVVSDTGVIYKCQWMCGTINYGLHDVIAVMQDFV